LFALYDHPTIELFSKKTISVYFFLNLALFLAVIIGCSSGVPPREPTIYDPGAPVRAVKYNESENITLYQDTGDGYLKILNGSVVAKNTMAKLAVKVEGGAYTDGRVFLSNGLEYQVEAKQENELYTCDYFIGPDQLLVPILVQVIYPNGYASKEKFILRTCAGAKDNQLILDGIDIFVGKDILATAQILKLIDIPDMDLGTVSMSLSEIFGTLALDMAADLKGLNLSNKTTYLDIHGLPNATSDAIMAMDVGIFIAENASAFPSGVTLYSNNDITHPRLNLTSTDVQRLFETDDPEVLAKCIGVNLSMDNLTQITKQLLNGSITFDVANFPIPLILSALGIHPSGKDQKIRVIFNPEGIAFDFRTSTPVLILDDLRIEYIEKGVPMWMMSLDMTFSLAISSHIEIVTDFATGRKSGQSSLDVHLSLVPDFSSQCHVMKDDQGIGLLDHSRFVEYLVKALGKKLVSYTGDDLMFSISMENYGLSLSDAEARSGAGRYFLKMVTTESDLRKTLSYIHTEH
jgi:hypothetical protein